MVIMKGFIYILEITIALTIILTIFITISNYKPNNSMERSILIEAGDNALKLIGEKDVYDIMGGNFTKLQSIIPKNMVFGLKIEGVPKDNILVGCIQPSMCNYISSMLHQYHVNNRTVNFAIVPFNIDSMNYIPQYLDALVLVNYTNYTVRKNNITNYLKNGGVVIGINATYANNNADFNGIFGLSSASASSGVMNFPAYDPYKDEIEKYFLNTGFDINTDGISGNRKTGDWYIWEVQRQVSISATDVNIANKTASEGFITGIHEGGYFNLLNPYDSKFYTFMVRKITWDTYVSIKPMNSSFTFRDITDTNDVTAKTGILTIASGQAGMGSNNTAVWISDFPRSDEYSSLVRSAIISRVKSYDAKAIEYAKKYATISSFYPLCCDMPEIAKMTLYLWYKL